MKQLDDKNQRGVGHLGAIVAVAVVLALGGVGYFVYSKNKTNTPEAVADKALQAALKNAKCDYDDKDLCKFFTSFKDQKYSTVNSVNDTSGKKTTMFSQTTGKNSHFKVTGETSYEIIVIDGTSYTKAANGIWWKQAADKDTVASGLEDQGQVQLDEPDSTATDKTTYKKNRQRKVRHLYLL